MKILFLCSGNMHRSPLAAALLGQHARLDRRDDLEIASAGTAAFRGATVVEEAALLAAEIGLDLTAHRSRPADVEEIEQADLVLVMESEHRDWIAKKAPVALERCRLLSSYAPSGGPLAAGEDVPDAIGESLASFRRTFAMLRSCVRGLYEQLPPAPQEIYARAVEERLSGVGGRAISLTPGDWQLLDQWWRRNVPLWLVLEAIDALGARRGPRGTSRRVRRLAACRDAVEERFAALRSTGTPPERKPLVGGEDRTPRPGPAEEETGVRALGEAARRARDHGWSCVGDLIEAAAASLRQIEAASASSDRAGARLRAIQLEQELLAGLLAASDPGIVERCREEATEELSAVRARMNDTAWERTLHALIKEKLRLVHEVPRITT